jgi:hypothetical protein
MRSLERRIRALEQREAESPNSDPLPSAEEFARMTLEFFERHGVTELTPTLPDLLHLSADERLSVEVVHGFLVRKGLFDLVDGGSVPGIVATPPPRNRPAETTTDP